MPNRKINRDFDLDLVPDPVIARQLGVTLMTIWRWSHDPQMGFPTRVKVGKRNYRGASELMAWRDRLAREGAKAARGGKAAR
jgi:hypothetical protein